MAFNQGGLFQKTYRGNDNDKETSTQKDRLHSGAAEPIGTSPFLFALRRRTKKERKKKKQKKWHMGGCKYVFSESQRGG